VRNGVIYVMPTIAATLIPFLTLPLYTRALVREEYGAWALSLAYAMFTTAVANFGLTLGYERNFFEHRDPVNRRQLLYTTLAFVILAYMALVLLTSVYRAPIAAFVTGSAAHANLLFCTSAAHGMMSLKAYYLIYFRNTGQARAHVWYSLDELVGASALGVLFVVGLRLGAIGIPLGQLLASSIVFASLTWRFLRDMPIAFKGALLREELKISYPLTPRILLGVVNTQLDKYLLGMLGALGGVGVYTVGQRLAYAAFSYMTALENVFTPQVYDRMFKLDRAAGADAIGRYLTPFAYASSLGALLIALFAEEVVVLLTPPPFHGAMTIAGVLALHYGLMFFGKIPQLLYAKKTGIISAMTFLSIAVTAGLNVLFIQKWGAPGAATATLLAGMTSLALALVLGQRQYAIRWQLAPLASIFGILFVGAVVAIGMREAGIAYGPRLGVRLALLAAYAALGVQLGILSRDNMLMVRTALLRPPAATGP
jgi:O-antigen/teichoic acid export membrane protein